MLPLHLSIAQLQASVETKRDFILKADKYGNSTQSYTVFYTLFEDLIATQGSLSRVICGFTIVYLKNGKAKTVVICDY